VLAPLIGPLLDRYRHGRRWAIGTTLATRAFLCWVLADAVATKSLWFFPAALGCLAASRAYNVTRASAVPRLLPHGVSLVAANSRQSLAGVAGMVLGGAIAGAAIRIGPDWSLRAAFVIYVVGTVLAIMLPARVDSSLGEEDIEQTDEARASSLWGGLWAGLRARPREGPTRRFRHRVDALTWRVLFALWCTAGTRLLAGFLTLFLAFLMRDHPMKGLSGTLVGLVAGLSGQLANLSLDALVQSDIGETVRTSVFAWAETLLQIAWVMGGGLGIALPLIPQLGFGIIAGLLVGTFLMAIRSRIARRRRKATVARPLRA